MYCEKCSDEYCDLYFDRCCKLCGNIFCPCYRFCHDGICIRYRTHRCCFSVLIISTLIITICLVHYFGNKVLNDGLYMTLIGLLIAFLCCAILLPCLSELERREQQQIQELIQI